MPVYTIDQWNVLREDDVVIPEFENEPARLRFLSWAAQGNSATFQISSRFIDPSITLAEKKNQAYLEIAALADKIVNPLTAKYPDCELGIFTLKVLMAKDYLANGENDFNALLVAESQALDQAVQTTCNIIIAHDNNMRYVTTNVSVVRQRAAKLIKGSTTHEQVNAVVDNFVPSLKALSIG